MPNMHVDLYVKISDTCYGCFIKIIIRIYSVLTTLRLLNYMSLFADLLEIVGS